MYTNNKNNLLVVWRRYQCHYLTKKREQNKQNLDGMRDKNSQCPARVVMCPCCYKCFWCQRMHIISIRVRLVTVASMVTEAATARAMHFLPQPDPMCVRGCVFHRILVENIFNFIIYKAAHPGVTFKPHIITAQNIVRTIKYVNFTSNNNSNIATIIITTARCQRRHQPSITWNLYVHKKWNTKKWICSFE